MMDIIQKIIPDLFAFIIQFSVFIFLCLIVMFFVYKPIKKILKKRNDFIDYCVKTSKENEKKSGEMLKEIEKRLKDVNNETLEILKKAEDESLKKSKQIISEAKEIYRKKMEIFEKEFEKELKNKDEEIKKIIIKTAYDMCTKVLKNKKFQNENGEDFKNFISELQKIEEKNE